MTERMGDEQLDREIRAFLAWQAEDVAGAPSATGMAARISERAGTATGLRVVPQLVWVLLAVLLVIALLGTLANVANQPPPAPPLPVSYEALFLRIEVVGETHAVVVVGVNDEGRERQIARLPGAWAAFDISTRTDPPVYVSPGGAVSPSGLLAVPSDRGDEPLMMHWEIFDLHQPQVDPVVVPGIRQLDVERPGDPVWGPGERLAITWHEWEKARCPINGDRECVTFVEGLTGASTTVILHEGLHVLPYWTSDGSGVFVGDDPDSPRRVLRPDGSVVDAPFVDAVPSCRTRDASGAELAIEDHEANYSLVRVLPDGRREVMSSGFAGNACLAPDDSAIIYGDELIDPHSDAKFHPKGNFAGWLEVPR
jgi:hypothetical protein